MASNYIGTRRSREFWKNHKIVLAICVSFGYDIEMEEWISRQEKQFSERGILTCCRHTHVASNLLRRTKFLQPSPLRGQRCVFAELSRVNAMNPAKHTRIAMKIWTYTSENGKKNCMGRDWISAEKQIIITRLLARIFWENSHQKSLFILERLWIFIAPDRCETLKTSWTRLSQYFEYTFFSIRWRGLNILIFLPILGRTFSCEYS